MLQPEGLVFPEEGTDGVRWACKYFQTDHTGSTRVLLAARNGSLEVEQTTDYYPFGLAWETNNLHLNRYLYSGKQIEDAVLDGSPLALYYFGARYYNPTLGRWFNVDPALQCPSPYQYCGNNPVLYTDPNGEVFGIDDLIMVGVMAYFGGLQANFMSTAHNPFNPGSWNWSNPMTYVGIALGGLSGYTQSMNALELAQAKLSSTYFAAEPIAFQRAIESIYVNAYSSINTLHTVGQYTFVASHMLGTMPGFFEQPVNAGNPIMLDEVEVSAQRSQYIYRNDCLYRWNENGRFYQLAGEPGLRLVDPVFDILSLGAGMWKMLGNSAQTGAKGAYSVYRGVDAARTTRYVGITGRDATVRYAEHIASGTAKSTLQYGVVDGGVELSRTAARVMEQNLINQYGLQKNGGLLLNKINSIAQKNWWKYEGVVF